MPKTCRHVVINDFSESRIKTSIFLFFSVQRRHHVAQECYRAICSPLQMTTQHNKHARRTSNTRMSTKTKKNEWNELAWTAIAGRCFCLDLKNFAWKRNNGKGKRYDWRVWGACVLLLCVSVLCLPICSVIFWQDIFHTHTHAHMLGK